jgi:hypothetical protein
MNTTPTTITRHPAPFAAVAAAVVAFAIGSVAVPTTSSAAVGGCVPDPHPPAATGQPGYFTGGHVVIGE